MTFRQHTGLRYLVLAGGLVLACSGAGAAAVWAGTAQSTTPLTSASASATQPPGTPPGTPPGQGQVKKNRAVPLHSESVVKKSDGSVETRLEQQGTIEAVSGSSITVKSEDGFSQAYAINAETKIVKLPPPAADGTTPRDSAGKKIKPSAATAADLKPGDPVRITGVRNGPSVTAGQIADGIPATKGPGRGLGKGQGLGPGKHLGHGRGNTGSPGANP